LTSSEKYGSRREKKVIETIKKNIAFFENARIMLIIESKTRNIEIKV